MVPTYGMRQEARWLSQMHRRLPTPQQILQKVGVDHQHASQASDGYNRRFDAVLQDFHRKERCVDDTVFWDEKLENHWWRVIKFLETMGRSGIVLIPDKFQFCAKDVEFAGFRITESRVAPLAKYIDAIRLFPTPQNIRSWFGLVNQVAGYGQLRSFL